MLKDDAGNVALGVACSGQGRADSDVLASSQDTVWRAMLT